MAKTLQDSGTRREFDTGAVRDMSAGKGRFDLIDPDAIEELALVLEAGCSKYGDRNWEQGIPQSSFMDSAMRHLNKVRRGDDDEDHLAAAFWNIHCMLSQRRRMETGRLPHALDDLPAKTVRAERDETIPFYVSTSENYGTFREEYDQPQSRNRHVCQDLNEAGCYQLCDGVECESDECSECLIHTMGRIAMGYRGE